jgi:acyl dehydratase
MAQSWDTLTEGTKGPRREYGPLTRTDFVRYQGASGDFNPIHHDEEFAKSAGFPGVFSVGMLQAGMLAKYVTNWLGVETIRRFKVRFENQVWPDDELTCTATITAVNGEAEGRRITVDLLCSRQDGSVALAGDAEFVLP